MAVNRRFKKKSDNNRKILILLFSEMILCITNMIICPECKHVLMLHIFLPAGFKLESHDHASVSHVVMETLMDKNASSNPVSEHMRSFPVGAGN